VTTIGPVAVKMKSVAEAVPPLTVLRNSSFAAAKGVNVLVMVAVMVLPASASVIVNLLPTKVPPPVTVNPLVVYPSGPVSVSV